jgi:hypothetical protein
VRAVNTRRLTNEVQRRAERVRCNAGLGGGDHAPVPFGPGRVALWPRVPLLVVPWPKHAPLPRLGRTQAVCEDVYPYLTCEERLRLNPTLDSRRARDETSRVRRGVPSSHGNQPA